MKQDKITAARGFKDVLSPDTPAWRHVSETARRLFEVYGYLEVILPVVERTEVFERGIGGDTDIVEKEMFSVTHEGGSESLSLRPEGTAGAVRAYIEHGMDRREPIQRIYYIGPMFRSERPQKGRRRQFHQIGAELFGIDSPRADAEIICLVWELLEGLGLSHTVEVRINSLGCGICRPPYKDRLRELIQEHYHELCTDCRRRGGKNPLRVLDCKNQGCKAVAKGLPVLPDYLCPDCKDHFLDLKESLILWNIPFTPDPWIVRGLDYYTRTVFEVVSPALGAKNAVAAGGRYDDLIGQFGGKPTPAVGFALGLERLCMLLPGLEDRGTDLFIMPIGDKAERFAFTWLKDLRDKGIRSLMDYQGRSLKSMMRQADRTSAKWALVVGEDEIKAKKVILRDMKSGQQMKIDMGNVVDKVAEIVKDVNP